MVIRDATAADAAGMVALNELLSRETVYMLRKPEELSGSIEAQEKILERVVASDDEVLLVAEANSRVVGFASAFRKPFTRVRHSYALVIGIEKSFWRQGIGERLMTQIEERARLDGATRLELTVIDTNGPATRLYKKCGFATEGRRVRAMLIGDEFVDELYMAKLL